MFNLDFFTQKNVLPLYIQDIKKEIDYSTMIPIYLLYLSFIFSFIFQVLAIIVFKKSYIYIVFILICYIILYKICISFYKIKYV